MSAPNTFNTNYNGTDTTATINTNSGLTMRERLIKLESQFERYRAITARACNVLRGIRGTSAIDKEKELPSGMVGQLSHELSLLQSVEWRPTKSFATYVITQYYKRAADFQDGLKIKKDVDAVWEEAQEYWPDPGPGLWDTLQEK